MLKLIVSGVLLCAASIAWAQSPGLSGQQITELVAGTTVEIDTPAGTKVPVRYTSEGRLSGEARDLAWFLGSPTDVGRWWVAGDQLCHKWIRWFNAEPQCMRLSREGRIIRWHSQDGKTGTAAIAIPAPVQASTLLALPRVFPRRVPQAAAAPEPPPALADAPPRREPAHVAAVPSPAPPPAAKDAAVEAEAGALAPPAPPRPAAAVKGAAPRQPESKQAEAKAATPPVQTASVSLSAQKHAEPRTVGVAPARPAEARRPARPTFKVANVRQDDVLNVRSGPSADHDIVGELPPGSRGIAITSECRARWCPVQHDAMAGWVNSIYLAPEGPVTAALQTTLHDGPAPTAGSALPPAGPAALHDSPEAPRSCLTPAARALLNRIEQKFGPVRVVSTCRRGATIAGTNHPSRHASGNAVDFDAGNRKAQVVEWLIAHHRTGGTMTYAGMDHIHVDIGPHFVSLAGGRHWSSWSGGKRDAAARKDESADDD